MCKSRDMSEIAGLLAPWLRERLSDCEDVKIRGIDAPTEGGSSTTYFVKVDLRQSRETFQRDFVLRVEATDYQVYRDASAKKQFDVMRRLGELGKVPVPDVFWFEQDDSILGAPFFMMEKIEGHIPGPFHHSSDFLKRLAPAQRRLLWQSAITTMSQIHTSPPEHFLFLAHGSTRADVLEAELKRWIAYMDWSGIEIRPIQRSARLWLAENLPGDTKPGLAWGDARPGNLVFDTTNCISVLDWETVSLAGAETDLAWWLLYDWMVTDGMNIESLPGWGSREDTINVWTNAAGRPLQNMAWHDIFAAWRYSLISDRARSLLRQRDPANPIGNNRRSLAVNRLEELLGV